MYFYAQKYGRFNMELSACDRIPGLSTEMLDEITDADADFSRYFDMKRKMQNWDYETPLDIFTAFQLNDFKPDRIWGLTDDMKLEINKHYNDMAKKAAEEERRDNKYKCMFCR